MSSEFLLLNSLVCIYETGYIKWSDSWLAMSTMPLLLTHVPTLKILRRHLNQICSRPVRFSLEAP